MPSINKLSRVFTSLLIWLVVAGTSISAQSLITGTVQAKNVGIDEKSAERYYTLRSRLVKVDLDAIGARVDIELFEGTRVRLTEDRIEEQAGSSVWVGKTNVPGAYAILSEHEGVLFGKVHDGKRAYLIRLAGKESDQIYIVEEIDFAAFPSYEGDTVIPDLIPGIKDSFEKQIETLCDTSYPAVTQKRFDLMIVYSPSARVALGGTASAQAAIAAAATEFNQVNLNSSMSPAHQVNLIHTQEVAYTESGTLSSDLSRVRINNDGYIDNVHTIRQTVGADAVVLIVNDPNECGVGYVLASEGWYYNDIFEPYMFSVVQYGCMTGNLSVPHEVAHNMGMLHDWSNSAPETAACAHHRGYVNAGGTGDRWRTVLAYNSPDCNIGGYCTRVPYWSNPNRAYGPYGNRMGRATNLSNPAYVALGVTRAMEIMADFFQAPLPIELTDFSAQIVNGEVVLFWETASELNNRGFTIERSVFRAGEESDFEPIEFIDGAGTTAQTQTYSLKTGTRYAGKYTFRLRQEDFNGSISYSPEISATVEINESFALTSPYPNPFNPTSLFQLSIARDQAVSVTLFDMQGRLIKEVFSGTLTGQNTYPITIDGSDLASGVYTYQVEGEYFAASGSVMLVK